MKKCFLLSSLFAVFLAGCGGSSGNSGGGAPKNSGIAFDAISPDIAMQGSDLDLYVKLTPVEEDEQLRTTTVKVTATSGVTIDEPSFDVTLPLYKSSVFHIVHVKLPVGAPVGGQYQVSVRRNLTLATGGEKAATQTITITDRDAEATLTPNSVSAPAGSAVTSTISMLPSGNASGTVTFDSNASYTVTPSTLTLTAGQTIPSTATVTFTLPTTASTTQVPVSWSFAGHRKFVPFQATVTE